MENKFDVMDQILGRNVIHKDFYLFLKKEMSYPHNTAIRYVHAIAVLFRKNKNFKDAMISKDIDTMKSILFGHIKSQSDKTIKFSVKHYLEFLTKKYEDKSYRRLYQEISDHLKGMRFSTKKEKNVLYTEDLKRIIAILETYEPHPTRINLNYRMKNRCRELIFLLKILYETGARANAILKLRIMDIMKQSDRYYIAMTEKGSERIKRPISKILSQSLEMWIKGKQSHEKLFTHNYMSAYVFLNRLNAKHHFMDGKFNFHAIRRGRANELYESSGHNVMLVKSYLGHRFLTTTQIYLDSVTRDFEKYADDVSW